MVGAKKLPSPPGWDKAYTYDKNGNRLTKVMDGNLTTYIYQEGTNRLIATVGYENDSFTYNNRGDVAMDSRYNYNYGDHKRLISLIDRATMEEVARYEYDYRLRRSSRWGMQTGWYDNYYYDQGDRLIYEVNDMGYGIDYIYLEQEPIAKVEHNYVDMVFYYHNDHIMTPMKMSDSSRVVVWEGEYYPFGRLAVEQGSVSNNLRFPGQYDDRISSILLYYN